MPPPGAPDIATMIGALCCIQCASSHKKLGVDICSVKNILPMNECELKFLDCGVILTNGLLSCIEYLLSTNKSSFTLTICYKGNDKEVSALEVGGNLSVNRLFEANLGSYSFNRPTRQSTSDERDGYIKAKYELRLLAAQPESLAEEYKTIMERWMKNRLEYIQRKEEEHKNRIALDTCYTTDDDSDYADEAEAHADFFVELSGDSNHEIKDSKAETKKKSKSETSSSSFQEVSRSVLLDQKRSNKLKSKTKSKSRSRSSSNDKEKRTRKAKEKGNNGQDWAALEIGLSAEDLPNGFGNRDTISSEIQRSSSSNSTERRRSDPLLSISRHQEPKLVNPKLEIGVGRRKSDPSIFISSEQTSFLQSSIEPAKSYLPKKNHRKSSSFRDDLDQRMDAALSFREEDDASKDPIGGCMRGPKGRGVGRASSDELAPSSRSMHGKDVSSRGVRRTSSGDMLISRSFLSPVELPKRRVTRTSSGDLLGHSQSTHTRTTSFTSPSDTRGRELRRTSSGDLLGHTQSMHTRTISLTSPREPSLTRGTRRTTSGGDLFGSARTSGFVSSTDCDPSRGVSRASSDEILSRYAHKRASSRSTRASRGDRISQSQHARSTSRSKSVSSREPASRTVRRTSSGDFLSQSHHVRKSSFSDGMTPSSEISAGATSRLASLRNKIRPSQEKPKKSHRGDRSLSQSMHTGRTL